MPETPDFEQIAREVLPFCLGVTDADDIPKACDLIAEQLRLIWNARGAADGQAVESRIRELVAGEIVGAGIARHVAEAIQKVDRAAPP